MSFKPSFRLHQGDKKVQRADPETDGLVHREEETGVKIRGRLLHFSRGFGCRRPADIFQLFQVLQGKHQFYFKNEKVFPCEHVKSIIFFRLSRRPQKWGVQASTWRTILRSN